ncbi:MAG: T9SS type A sorting domain-containing protein [Bacteroidetes bacterium]|nr:T9SS type A sorting domain-containing protein [Bacteroidota bacterium]
MKQLLRKLFLLTVATLVVGNAEAQYCNPSIAIGCSAADYIQSFSTSGGITNISNPNTGCQNAATGINAYLSMVHTAVPSMTVNFTVTNTPSFPEYYRIFVDWNIDGDMTDPGEEVWYGGQLNSGQTVSSSFVVPSTATPGTTRMRVMCVYATVTWGPCSSVTFGEIEDYTFVINAPCSGVPNIYSVTATPNPVCPGKPLKVSLAGLPQTQQTYEWKYSDDGVSWQNYTGVVGAYGDINDVIYNDRWYRCKITCTNSGQSYTTPAYLVKVAGFMYCYCDNGAAVTTGLDVGNVKVLAMPSGQVRLDNGISTPAVSNTNSKYAYSSFQYTVPPVVMYRDSTFKFSVSSITSAATMPATVNVVVFVDMDRNGIFDATDKVLQKKITAASTVPNTESNTFTIPHDAQIGLTGMRVIASTGNPDSCGFGSAEGETEDYLVDMRWEPCKGPANAGDAITSVAQICPDYDYMVTDTTYEKKKSELQRLWQVSADNIGWTNMTGSNDQDQLNKIFTGQPLYYRVRMVCPRTSDTTYSTVGNIKPKDGYKCYCYSQSVGGNVKDTSDIGGITIGNYTMNTGGPHLLNPAAYSKRTDHTDEAPLQLFADSTYIITVYHTQHSAIHADAKVTIFIDYNNNKQYDVPYERVYTGYTSVSNFTIADTFTIPSVVITGVPTGMRFIINNNLAPNTPSDEACGPYTSGETHDFIVALNKIFPEGVKPVGSISNLAVYPNPNDGKFMLQFNNSGDAKQVDVTISNVTGQQVFHQMYTTSGSQFSQQINLNDVAKGVYIVELNANGEKLTQKLVIR